MFELLLRKPLGQEMNLHIIIIIRKNTYKERSYYNYKQLDKNEYTTCRLQEFYIKSMVTMQRPCRTKGRLRGTALVLCGRVSIPDAGVLWSR